MPFAIVGDAQQLRELLCGPIQHNEHMKGWRWFLYTRDAARRVRERDAILMAEVRKMAAERHERLEALRAEVAQLEAAE